LLDTILDVLGADTMRTKPQSETDRADTPLAGVRVLLAEDNPVNQQLAIEMLASVGVAVDVAGNGAEAVQRADERRYDAFLMDIEMPEMDGYTAARLLRERSPDGPPIIAMTAHATADHRRRCIEAGMVDVVTKPVLFDELLDTLRKHTRPAQTPTAHASPPAVDAIFDARTAIARMNGNAALFGKLVAMFPDLHRTAAADIAAALVQGDVRTAVRIAHSVGGAAGNLAATRLHAAAMALENAGEQGRPSEAQIAEFDAALKLTLLACENYIVGP
jgi:CheY-like chemotaxis protein/HPt (histidine-containing phosphotransfer) domain-containing protein